MVCIFCFSANKQKSKRKLRSRPESDIITKDRLTTTECQDDKDETSSTTTESSTGDGDEKVRFVGLPQGKTAINPFKTAPEFIFCHAEFNPSPAEPGYILPLQTV